MKRRNSSRLSVARSLFGDWPGTRSRPKSARRIGMLIGTFAKADREGQDRIAAFLDTFQKLGWSDGRNFRMDYHWGAGNSEEIAVTAKELLRATPDVIVVAGNAALAELRRQTSTIPAVFIQISDPVGSGFVASLARPGGNMSGFQNFEPAMGGKWLGVLKEASPAPGMSRVAGCSVRTLPQHGIPARGRSGRAVTRSSGHSGRCIAGQRSRQRHDRDQRRDRNFRQSAERRLDCHAAHLYGGKSRIDHCPGGAVSSPRGLSIPILRDGGRDDVVRAKPDRSMAARQRMSIVFCAAESRAICRCSSRRNSNW